MALIKDEEAERLIEGLDLRAPREKSVAVCSAANMLASADVISPVNLPSNDIAAQDGYAVRIMEGAKSYTITDSAGELNAGEAVYTGTGWPIPKGANSVVRIESARVDGKLLIPANEPKLWGDIERAGEDLTKGTAVLRRGNIITPYHVSLLSALGVMDVKVFDICVGILSVGDEIIPCDSTGEGIRDSLTPLIKGLMPFVRFMEAHAPDTKSEISSVIKEFSRKCDMVITTGGSSVGKKDLTKDAINDAGEMVFEGVQTNIIKRGGVGLVNGVPVLSLPGRVVSAVTVFHAHGLHIISRLIGSELRKYGEVGLAEDMRVKHSMNSTFLFRIEGESAVPLKWGSGLYGQMVNADAFARLERNREYRKGEKIRVQFLINHK
ncbi:MAG: molybdopterin molybdotransferase MoeA [Nitrososphaerota archaeon]|jgi:molybdopterin molybdotransferase|nr:molybdopterin molybdotransferase MoeA [Nitrososphaerota archaeon]MDG6927026.1 molybdopterin molybdotransferase MoeA [Nitrososphaerota archaeon]MDG6930413.1 molybdopterin molybdotransferase MoeA [Nitrososphaerota archaeon]MDG6931454.1 molybdopterin molybdotransferase MoeA [Nitrososphaerota archaeon]MDG6936441.1 molybdopterin molybdotransferase MoeA [Nitrososphaerota archaeon]